MSNFLNELFLGAEIKQVNRGTCLFHTGDSVRFMHIVESGAVHLERTQLSGVTLCFQTARASDVLAEASLYAPTYHCDARVVETAELRQISVSHFIGRLRDPELSQAWAAYLARAVQKTRLLAEIRGRKTVEQRLDAWIGENGNLPAKGKWQDVAQDLAVSREALYREIGRRRANGLILNGD